MAMATAMYHSRKNPLHKVDHNSEVVDTARTQKARTLHKAFLRYHDPANWPMLREALKRMGRSDLIGNSERHLVPREGGAADRVANRTAPRRTGSGQSEIARKYGLAKPAPGKAGGGRASSRAGAKGRR
jgi:hypothetical protein